ncbi:MAG: glycosyltransferase, partial [Arenimonas sp.]
HTPKTDSDSGSLRLYHLMQCLQKENCDVHFLPADLTHDGSHTTRLQQSGIACHYRPWAKSAYDWLQENGRHFDSIIVCRVSLMDSLYDSLRKAAPKTRLIFDTVDLHHIREMQEAELSNSESLKKQALLTKAKEYALIAKCDETWVVSDTEYSALHDAFPEKTVRRISNIHELRTATPSFVERRDILFVGNFRHPPNQDGLQWFLETIWPAVHSKCPDIRLNIVGAAAPENLVRISEGMNVVFHGRVEDIESAIDAARINIAPLCYGAGVKGKISQALASGLPTIATTVAADGMGLINEESIWVADKPEDFVSAILALYEDEKKWNFLSKNAYEVAEQLFSERTVAREISGLFRT